MSDRIVFTANRLAKRIPADYSGHVGSIASAARIIISGVIDQDSNEN